VLTTGLLIIPVADLDTAWLSLVADDAVGAARRVRWLSA